MRSKQDRTSIRILSLALNLLNTRTGHTRSHIRDLMGGYADMTDEAFQRTFERDIAALRESGLNVELSGVTEPRYFIRSRERSGPAVELTAGELKILLRAASAWEFASPVEMSRLSLKLNSKLAPGELEDSSSKVEERLEGAQHLQVILEAMALRQPISFEYAPRSGTTEERDVAALSLLTRGTAVYLWGYDFNRDGERWFRLSRIVSKIRLVAEPDCYVLPDQLPAEVGTQAAQFDVSPLLWVKEGAAPHVRLRSGSPLQPSAYPPGVEPRRGWDLVRGEPGDWSAWETILAGNAAGCVVAAPRALRSRMLALLGAAADFQLGGGNQDGE